MPFHLTDEAQALIKDMQDKRGAISGGPELSNDYLDGAQSMGELCVKRLTQFGQQVIMIDAVTGQRVTAIALRDAGIRAAICLQAIGVCANDTVAISCDNRLEFVDVMLGTFMIGARLTPINPTYTDRELDHAVRLSRPRVIFVAPSVATKAAGLKAPHIERIVVFDEVDKDVPNACMMSYSAFMAAGASQANGAAAYVCTAQPMATHPMLVLYSSGTTGIPKGVQLTQLQSLLAVHRNYHRKLSDKQLQFSTPPISLTVLPYFHTYGLHVLLSACLCGAQLVALPRFEPQRYLRAIDQYKCTNLLVAPPLLVFLAKSPLVAAHDLSSVRVIFSGAAPLSPQLIDAVQRRLPGKPHIRQGYGITEGTLACTGQTDRCQTPGSVGELVPGVWGRVVDPETGRVLGADRVGELQFKGNAMLGYVNDVEATAQVIGPDGWLRTGDIGYYTAAKGEWFVVDRQKELIKYKGFQVAPAEIEALLLQMTKVQDVGVCGVADEQAGELPMAFVVRQKGVRLSEAEVVEHVRRNSAPSKWLRGGVRFVAAIPKNVNGKILRRELRVMAGKVAAKL